MNQPCNVHLFCWLSLLLYKIVQWQFSLYQSLSFSLILFLPTHSSCPPHLHLSFIVSLSVTDLLLPLPHILFLCIWLVCLPFSHLLPQKHDCPLLWMLQNNQWNMRSRLLSHSVKAHRHFLVNHCYARLYLLCSNIRTLLFRIKPSFCGQYLVIQAWKFWRTDIGGTYIKNSVIRVCFDQKVY